MTSDILVNKPTKDMPRIVSSKKVSNITGAIVELDPLATPCCLRLLDCAALLDFDKLQIIEYPPATSIHDNSQTSYPDFSSLPLPPFAAVSYPWRGLQLPPGAAVPSFYVSDATDADPISINVLRTVCLAAHIFSRAYLWLDRLCILRTQKRDKNWLIQQVFRIYRACDTCLVLPGGLARLAGLNEPTTWIDRAWTCTGSVSPRRGESQVYV